MYYPGVRRVSRKHNHESRSNCEMALVFEMTVSLLEGTCKSNKQIIRGQCR